MKRESNQHLSGNAVYYTNSFILLVKNMLCGQLHYQKGFNFLFIQGRSLSREGCAISYEARPSEFRVQHGEVKRLACVSHFRFEV